MPGSEERASALLADWRRTDTKAGRAFHFAIARATRNHAVFETIERLWDLRNTSPEAALLHEKARTASVKPVVEEHRVVLKALKARDTVAARAAMRAHLPPCSTACSSPPRKRRSRKRAERSKPSVRGTSKPHVDHDDRSARTPPRPEALVRRVSAGSFTPAEAEMFRDRMLTEMAAEPGGRLVMQLHPGSFRNHNAQIFVRFNRRSGSGLNNSSVGGE